MGGGGGGAEEEAMAYGGGWLDRSATSLFTRPNMKWFLSPSSPLPPGSTEPGSTAHAPGLSRELIHYLGSRPVSAERTVNETRHSER